MIDILVLAIAAIVLGVSMVWSRDIELKLGLLYYVDASEADAQSAANGTNVLTSAEGSARLDVHFVDVGQGDCAIIELPDDKTILIDGGENRKEVETAIQTFIDETFDENFKYFDYAILTHPDSDHCGSIDYVLNNYPARVVYRPNVEGVGTNSNPYVDPGKAELTADAVEKNTAVYANALKAMYTPTAAHDFTPVVHVTDPSDDSQTISGGEGDDRYSLTFYTPLSSKYTGEGDWNNYSPVMILEYRGFKYAMSGDAEEGNLDEFVARVKSAKTDGVTDKYDVFDDEYSVNVIKAGHHGSVNATTPAYLDTITSPGGTASAYCVISCGAGNKYGHPHAEAVARYKAIGIPEENILRTDISGTLSFSVRASETDDGYAMYFGDKKTDKPDNPEKPNDPEKPDTPDVPETPDEPVKILVYRKLGGIELRWAVVAWVGFAVLVVLAAIHVTVFGGERAEGDNGRRNNGRRRNGGGRRR